MSLGIATAVGGYTVAHYREEKNLKWFMKIGYDVIYSIIGRLLEAKFK